MTYLGMRKDVGRKLDHATLEAIRRRAVTSIVDQHEDPQTVAKVLDCIILLFIAGYALIIKRDQVDLVPSRYMADLKS